MITFDCGLHADCVKFVPGQDELFVVACYELVGTERKGKLILANRAGEIIQEVADIPGVFDFCWCCESILAVALATGAPSFYEFDRERKCLTLLPIACSDPFDMTLAVTGSSSSLITCDNKGQLRLSQEDAGSLQVVAEWNGHDSEVWYVAEDIHDSNLFYSCSDEGAFKIWDRRSIPSHVFVDKRSHEAGVCCAASNPHEEFIFATGSYDENVRIWDRRALRQPQRVIGCGSGAWRVVWNPERSGEFGVAVMRKGFYIYDAENDEPVAGLSTGDETVAYGLDLKGDRAVSCSFYNNQVQIWEK